MTGNGTRYTLALLPAAELSEQVKLFSRRMAINLNSEIILGEGVHPHLTILQWEDADLELLREQLQGFSHYHVGSLTAAGLTIGPQADGVKWISISYLNSGKLRELQSGAIQATMGNGRIVNNVDELFWPHVTIGLTRNAEISFSVLESEVELLRQSTDNWEPHLGISGKHWVFASTVSWN